MPALLIALSFAGFIVVACMRVSDPLLPVLAEEFDVSVGQAGIVATAYAVAYGLFLLAYGPLGDRYGKLKVIAVTLTGASACVAACAFAESLEQLAILRFLTGMASAAAVPLAIAWIGDNVDLERRQRTIARYMGGVIFGQMIGSALGGILSDWLSWRAIFVLFGACTALSALLVWRYADGEVLAMTPRSPLREAGLRYLELARDPRAADVLTSAIVEGFCVFGGLAYVGALLHIKHDLSYTQVGLSLLAYGLGGLLYSAAAPIMLSVLGQRGMISHGGVVMGWSLIVIGASPVLGACVGALGVLGFGFYLMHNTLQTLATEMTPSARGTALSLFAFVLFGGQALGVTTIGWLIDYAGYTFGLGFAGAGVGLLGLWMQGSPVLARKGR